MDEETKKIIGDQLKSLPKTIQDAILNSGWEKKTHALAKKYQLHIDQEGTLVNETFLVLLGLELTRDFNQNLVDNLGISKIIASQIEGDLSEDIFKPIRKELQNLNEKIIQEETPATNPTNLAREILGVKEPTQQVVKEENTDDLDRDAILREIEAPVVPASSSIIKPPVKTSASTAPIKTPAPAPTPTKTISTIVEPMPAIAVPPPPVKPASSNMVDDKLKNVVTSQPKRSDPYREPIS